MSTATGLRAASGNRRLYAAVFIFLLFTFYTETPLFLSPTLSIPGFMTVLASPFVAILCWKSVKRSDLRFIGQAAGILLLSAVFSPGSEHIWQKLQGGVLQTTFSLVMGVLLVKTMDHLEPETVSRILAAIVAVLVVGTALELLGILSDPSDRFRQAFFSQSDYGVYEAESRDTDLAGFTRPKFFTSEPSLLAIGFFVFANSRLLLSCSYRHFLVTSLLTCAMIVMTASPVLLISVPVSVAILLSHTKSIRMAVAAIVVIAIITALFSVTDTAGLLLRRFDESLDNAVELDLTSENLRIVFPFLTTLDVLGASPLFGVGISGKDVIPHFSRLSFNYSLINNNLAGLFIFLGLGGATLFIYVFRRYLKKLGISNRGLLLIIFLGFSQMMGAFQSPRVWGYAFLFIGVARLQARIRCVPACRPSGDFR